jgi:hypothetical protein
MLETPVTEEMSTSEETAATTAENLSTAGTARKSTAVRTTEAHQQDPQRKKQLNIRGCRQQQHPSSGGNTSVNNSRDANNTRDAINRGYLNNSWDPKMLMAAKTSPILESQQQQRQ